MDGNAPNMFHGNDSYFRYDGTAGGPPQPPPRPMGPPPGAYARHRAPHPGMQQQQPQGQYPGYQPTATDNMYGMVADPQAAMAGMNDMGAWGAASAQASPYGAPGMAAYNHPQMQQHQRQPQAGYRQHMSGYGQQDPKMQQYPVQQNVMGGMVPGQGYGSPAAQQPNPSAQAQRGVPPHYPQSHVGGMYPGAQSQAAVVAQSPYGAAAAVTGYHPQQQQQQQQHQPSRAPPHHIGYGHSVPMEQAYGHHQQQQQQQPANNHMQQAQQQQQQHQPHVPTPQVHGLGAMQQQQQHGAGQQGQQQQQHHLASHHSAHQQAQMHGSSQQPPHSAAYAAHMAGGYGVEQQQQQNQSVMGGPPTPQQQQQQQQQQPYLPPGKPLTAGTSPQYRAPFPQLSPQMSSPRPPQISPHPQMSPRPVSMSPAKPPPQTSTALSPHPHGGGVASPRPGGGGGGGVSAPQVSAGKNSSPVTTLQALEQMVMPGAVQQQQQQPLPGVPMNPMEYSQAVGAAALGYRQHPGHPSMNPNNPLSPMGGPRMPMSPQHQQQQQQQWAPPPIVPNSHPMAVVAPPPQQQQQHRQSHQMYPIPPHSQQQAIQAMSQQQQQQQVPIQAQQQQQQHLMTDLSGVMGGMMGGYGGGGGASVVTPSGPSGGSLVDPLGMSQMPQVVVPPVAVVQQQQQQQVVPPLQHSIDNQLNNTPHQIQAEQQQQMVHQNSLSNQQQQQQQKELTDPMSQMTQQATQDHLLMDPFAAMDTSAVSSVGGEAGSSGNLSSSNNNMSLESSMVMEGLDNGQQQQMQQVQQQQHQQQQQKDAAPTDALKSVHDQVETENHQLMGGGGVDVGSYIKEKDTTSSSATLQYGSGDDQSLLHSKSNNNLMDGGDGLLNSQQQQQSSYDSQSDNSQSSQQQQQQQHSHPHHPISGGETALPCQTEITSTDEKKSMMMQQQQDCQTTLDPNAVIHGSMHQLPVSMDGQMAIPPAAQVLGVPNAAAEMMGGVGGGYGMLPPTPLLMHHQERGMIQQQLQELYCLLPGPETQEKIHRLQERMNLLQQHEINEQCNGGAHCLLQPPHAAAYVPPMIDSPQVSSTTGRGRGRGIAKPRKPRNRKGEKQQHQQQHHLQLGDASESSPIESSTAAYATNSLLPVSEDCVTPGAGLTDILPEMLADGGLNDSEDEENSLNKSLLLEDGEAEAAAVTDKGKKKKNKKAREPKPPKEAKKKKEPSTGAAAAKKGGKDGAAKKSKKGRGKSDESELDSTIDASMDTSKMEEDGEEEEEVKNEEAAVEGADQSALNEDITDFDDIPVSKIAVQEAEAAAAAAAAEVDGGTVVTAPVDGDENPEEKIEEVEASGTAKKKRSGGSSRSAASRRSRPSSSRKPSGGGGGGKSKSRRSRMITESDGEGEDMLATPPASPVGDDLDNSKRRSGRNTQRKKYTDDVMLRFSDDDSELTSPSTSKKEKKSGGASSGGGGGSSAATAGGASSATAGGAPGDGGEGTSTAAVTSTEATVEAKDLEPVADDFGGKPNYVYVNTTDEDSMVVQLVLAMRIGKRELKPDPPPPAPVEVVPAVKKEEPEEDEEEVKKEVAEEEKNTTTEHNVEEKMETAEEEEKNEKTEGEEDEAVAVVEAKEKDEEVVEKPEEPELMKTDDSEQPIKADSSVEASKEESLLPEAMETAAAAEEQVKTEVESPEKKENIPTEATGEEEAQSSGEVKKETTTTTTTEEVDEEAETKKDDENKPEPVFVEVEEYFVKYRNFSYLHCEWRTEEELTKGDRRVAAKIKRFLQKQSSQMNIFDNMEEEPFNPDFTEVDRVLDMSEHKDEVTAATTKHYLVKWKSLPYEDCTWELEEDVDHIKIEQFERFTKLPPKNEWKGRRRPHTEQWKKLEKSPIYKAGNNLRPYQLEGLNWLKFSWFNHHNCILADEMGLGKTIQSLTFVHSIWEYGIRGPFLVIAPLSTIPNWQREFESWTDMNVIVYHGSANSKLMLQEYEFYYKNDNGKVIKDLTKFNVLITTFEMIVTDYVDLKQFNWRCCVIDEAHRLKNRNCKLLEGLRQLSLEHRVLLSGTPLQNNVSELFSLLNFLEPNQFQSSEDFTKEFGSLKTESEVQKLQALLKPMMLRRLKDDVEKSLAPKEETVVEVELTNIQKKYYRGILEQNFSFLSKGTTAANIPNLMNTMMELRKCCIHPYLLNGAEENIQHDHTVQYGYDPDAYHKNLVNSSGKMVLLDKLLPKLKANGHRVLIFSQMVRCLDLLEDYLMFKRYTFERIDGRIRGDLRQAAIDRYSKPDSDRFVFLLCTKAGGVGINLTAADTVIIFDSDWNPQNDLQAQARCHRIGQQKMVKIYRLLCRNTYEREMFDKASLKLGLDKAILQSMNTTQGKETNAKQMSKKEIEELLKKGAYGAIMDEDAGDKFCEEDIDSILKRRTQVITMESEKGSTFSKASFAMSGNRSDINIDDPDFWKKWAKKADIDPTVAERDEKEDLVLLEPRRRTQIKRFGHDEGGVGVDISEDSLSDSAEEGGGVGSRMKRRREKRDKKRRGDDKEQEEYVPMEPGMSGLTAMDLPYGNWNRTECFKVEKGLLSFGWGRWPEILDQGAFKKSWRDADVEELARIILLYCLRCYKGDEKIKNFIWDLIAPLTEGEDAATFRNHSGLHNLVPRGRNAKGRQGKGAPKEQPGSSTNSNASSPRDKQTVAGGAGGVKELDPNHWSHDEKYDCEAILDSSYKKHLGRHANKVLLRVRMLFYIKHEIIGDYVQQIADGVNVRNFGDPMVLSYITKSLLRDLPIRPPLTSEQMPTSWWIPNCCDKSLLVGTYKHGCENYQEIRSDSTLCFITHIGLPPSSSSSTVEDAAAGGAIANNKAATPTAAAAAATNMEEDVKLMDEEDGEDGLLDGKASLEPKAGTSAEDRPGSSGLEDDDVVITGAVSATGDDLTWPSMQDLNTRLRRVITSYQRNYKKEELRAAQQEKQAKIQAKLAASASPMVVPSGSSSASSTPTPTGSSGSGNQGQQQSQQQQASGKQSNNLLANQIPGMSSAVDMLLSLGFGINPNDPQQLANIDINKLAMYLQKFGSKEALEKQMRDRERMRLQQSTKKWSRKEENEFLRVLTCYGIDLMAHTSSTIPNWTKFKAMARLEKKSDDALSDYYKVFIAMCKRQAGVKLLEDERGLENIIDDINEDHARLILDRLELLSKLREVAKSSKLEDRLTLCKNNYDTPDWWEPGKHDLQLIRAILKHGLYKSEGTIMEDPAFSFRDACAEYEENIRAYNVSAMLKMEADMETFRAQEKERDALLLVAGKVESPEKMEEESKLTATGEEDKEVSNGDKELTEVVKSESPESTEEETAAKDVEKTAVEKVPEVDEKPTEMDGDDVNMEKEPTPTEADVAEKIKADEVEGPKSPVKEDEKEVQPEESNNETAEEVKSPAPEVSTEEEKEKMDEEAFETAIEATESEEAVPAEIKEVEEKMDCDDSEPKLSINEEELKDVEAAAMPVDEEAVVDKDQKETIAEPASPKADEEAMEKDLKESEVKSTEETEDKEALEKVTAEEPTEEKEAPMETTVDAPVEKDEEEKEDSIPAPEESSPVEEAKPEKESEDEHVLVPADKETTPAPPTTVVLPKIDLMSDLKMVEEDCKQRAAELKARFPDLEVIQPPAKGTTASYEDAVEVKPVLPPQLMEKQLLIRWFRDFALEKRISHIIYCVERNDWPVGKSYSAYTGCQGMDLDVPLFETIKRIPVAIDAMSNQDIITINTDQGLSKQLNNSLLQSLQTALGGVAAAAAGGVTMSQVGQQHHGQGMGGSGGGGGKGSGKGRKRHIAIDVETERAKLHALLNNTQSNQSSSTKWLEDELKGVGESRRGGSGGSSLQPPPAHQPVSRSAMNAAAAAYNKTTLIPGTSSTLTPIDLSSSFPKVNMADMIKNPIDLSEVQDFSISSKGGKGSGSGQQNVFGMQMGGGGGGKGSKLDSMLSKLMKKNNVPVPTEESAPMGKANKKRKLDEIVMGLSSAQTPSDQKMYSDPMLTPSSSHRKAQITPSVSVTPANVSGLSSSSNQKPFTITVTSVPAGGQGSSSSSSKQQQQQQQSQKHNPLSGASGLAALQSMAGLSGASSKELNAYIAEAAKLEQQNLLKQHQKLLQQLPANSPHRKTYEAMYNELKQMADLSQLYNQKLGNYSGHDAKVNKWLAEHQQSMDSIGQAQQQQQQQAASSAAQDYNSGRGGGGGGRGQRSTRQTSGSSSGGGGSSSVNQIQQKQDAVLSRFSLTGEETVPVIHKISGKRLSGNKAPQLKRITQWLAENPAYEIDPKWLELAQMPMAAPSPKPSPSAESTSSTSSAKQQQQQSRSSSSNNNAMSSHQYQSGSGSASSSSSAASKKQRASEVAALNAALQFPGLQGLNPQLLSQLGVNFDPKNPLSMLPFAGMAPGLGALGNMNNMNLLTSLAGLSGLGNMDAQTLATMMAASGLDANTLASLTASMSGQLGQQQQQQQQQSSSGSGRQSSGGGGKGQGSTSSSSRGSKAAKSEASQGGSAASGKGGANNSNFPFLFPNPNMMYPLGLNPYGLNPNMSPYDQLAQYSLLNGGPGGSGGGSGNTSASPRQGGKSSSSGGGGGGGAGRGQQSSSGSSYQGNSSGGSKGQSRAASSATAAAAASLASGSMSRADLNHLQSLLPHDPMLLESLGRVAAGLDITRSSGGGGGGGSDKKSSSSSSSAAAAKEAERRKQQAESLSRSTSNFPMDMATIQALAQGKLPPSLAKASAKDLQMLAQLPPELSQAFLLEMAQAAGMNLGGLPGMGGSLGGGGSSSSSRGGGQSSSQSAASLKRSREPDLQDLENLNKAQMEMLARNLGMSSSISLIPTSGGHGGEGEKSKRSRTSDQGSSSRSQQSVGQQLKQQTDEAAAAFAMAMAEAKMRSAMQQSMSGGGGMGERSRASQSRERGDSSSSVERQRKSSESSSSKGEREQQRERQDSSVMNLSSLPSQTTITLSSPNKQQQHSSSSSSSQMKSPMQQHQEGGGGGSGEGKSSSSSSSMYKSRSDYDLEDFIAPSKVNKSNSSSHTDPMEEDGMEDGRRGVADDGDENGERRRTRAGKRPRSGDDMEAMVGGGGGSGMPERKRELRSSAGRAAAAAAARIAAEAKAAAAQHHGSESGHHHHQQQYSDDEGGASSNAAAVNEGHEREEEQEDQEQDRDGVRT